jgi:hypothetical protein
MTPEEQARLEEIRDSLTMEGTNERAPWTSVRALLAMVDSLREELRAEMSHEDTCPQDTKVCLCCPCTCPTRAELRATVDRMGDEQERLTKERDGLREALALAREWICGATVGPSDGGRKRIIESRIDAALAPTKTEET